MSELKQENTFQTVKEMIDNVAELGNLDVIINGVVYGLACGYDRCHRQCGWEWDHVNDTFNSLKDALYAPVFDGKSLVDLFDVADFSMN